MNVTALIFDAEATCPVTWGRDGWELDSPETETSIGGEWVNPDRIQVLDDDGKTWRTLTQMLIEAAEKCDARPEYFGDDRLRDAAE